MRNILIYSAVFDGEYYKDIGYICSFENEEIANKVCDKLNNYISIDCANFCKKTVEEMNANDYVLNNFLKEDKLERTLTNRLIEILDISKTKILVNALKKESSYIYIEEKTFKIKEIQEF